MQTLIFRVVGLGIMLFGIATIGMLYQAVPTAFSRTDETDMISMFILTGILVVPWGIAAFISLIVGGIMLLVKLNLNPLPCRCTAEN